MINSNIAEIRLGTASCGIASGAGAVLEKMQAMEPDFKITEVGCVGCCYAEPLAEVITKDGQSIFYGNLTADEKCLANIFNLSEAGRFSEPEQRSSKMLPRVLKLAGRIDPISLEAYRKAGGYHALGKAQEMAPEAIVNAVKESGLRGRGGGGFSTGMKWSFLAAKNSPEKIIICNADEGDPGAFMDRSIMESVPHQVLEGMLIAAAATGATKLFIYCRAEYPMAIRNLKIAIAQINENKLNVIKGRTIEIIIKEGAGAFVCGEETALIASLEGKRGTPRFRPPFPTDSGYHQLPTMINNVETFGNIPLIIDEGAAAYASIGTENSKGTKIFALAGDLKYPGLAEVPMGITLREIVFDIGGADPENVKAVQTGGPSGGCIPVELFDTPIDYDSLRSLGAIMGSGGLIVIGKNRCMVETARYFLDFTRRESCGKCTFCRVGTTRMFETLERITKGEGKPEDIDFLETLGNQVRKGSLCGLGQTAPNPVLATLRYFKNEYLDHVEKRTCTALECNALVKVKLDQSKCVKCKLCIKSCPVGAISSDFVIDADKCTRCNSCIELCPKKAISRYPNE